MSGLRRAFTLIEILAVIAIVGILVGMMLPAIQSARESARRTQCAAKLGQLGVALGGYEATAGRYPPGVASTVWRSVKRKERALDDRPEFGFYYWSTFLHILLPRLDEQAYFDGIRGPLFRLKPFAEYSDRATALDAYERVNGLPLPPLLCPSDDQGGAVWGPVPKDMHEGQIKLAKSNYLGFFSGTTVKESLAFIQPVTPSQDPREKPLHPLPPRGLAGDIDRRAIFGYAVGTPLQTVRDGTGHTIAIGECLRGASDRDGRGAFWYPDAGMQSLQATNAPNSRTPDVLHPVRYRNLDDAAAEDWGCRDENSPNNLPNRNLPCRGGETSPSAWRGSDCFATSRSRHRDGVNVLFVDGRVVFINDTIESSNRVPFGTWQRLVWIDDGQSVSVP